MYRDYEDPRELERAIDRLCKRYNQLLAAGASAACLHDIQQDIWELRDRAAIAWADEDYDTTSDW